MAKDFIHDILNEEIQTQYNDMRGVAAIDGHESSCLNKLCKDNGVDLEKLFLVGLEFYDSEVIGQRPINMNAYLIEKEDGEDTYDKIAKRLSMTPKVIIHKKSFHARYEDLAPYIKRLHIGVVSRLSENIQDAEFVDD